jgi:adenosylcobinamide-GDP ribazoletransferase
VRPRRELDRLLCAAQLLTRAPTPRLGALEPDWMARSAKYFPLVGQVVGAACGFVWLVSHRIWGAPLAAVLAIAVGPALTGAFHEDGLADVADGLVGGQSPEQRLAIMKDSRVGTYGVVALGVCMALRVVALAGLTPGQGALALIGAHGGGRLAGVAVLARLTYAGDPTAGKLPSEPSRLRGGELAFAALTCLWPLIFLGLKPALIGIALGAAAALWVALTARRLIGGYTGDVLGAAEQLFETAFLLGVAAVSAHGGR